MERKSKGRLQPSIIHPQRVDLTYLDDLFSSEVGWHLASVMAWIIEDGRHIKKPARFIGQLCDKIIEAGAPIWRLGLDVRTIHPRFRGLAPNLELRSPSG